MKKHKHKKNGQRRLSPEERAAVNRQNAQNSTGPKTEEGKAKSSQNAFKHGLTGGFCLTQNDNESEFWEQVDKLVLENQPQGFEEMKILILIAEIYWRIDRCTRLESHAIDDADNREIMDLESRHTSLYHGRLQRQLMRYKQELRQLRAERRAGQRTPIPNADLFPASPAETYGPQIPVRIPYDREAGAQYRRKREDMAMSLHRPTEGGLRRGLFHTEPMASFFQTDEAGFQNTQPPTMDPGFPGSHPPPDTDEPPQTGTA